MKIMVQLLLGVFALPLTWYIMLTREPHDTYMVTEYPNDYTLSLQERIELQRQIKEVLENHLR